MGFLKHWSRNDAWSLHIESSAKILMNRRVSLDVFSRLKQNLMHIRREFNGYTIRYPYFQLIKLPTSSIIVRSLLLACHVIKR